MEEAMQALSERENALSFVTEWWRNWKNRRAAIDELNRCGEDEAAHIARDVGVSPSELQTLAGKWPDSTDLLSGRIVAAGLRADNIRATEPMVLRDLQRVCTQCAERSRCEHDLDRDKRDRVWRGYCPNVTTLDALRSEERDRRLMRRSREWRSF
jgi:hypothetical protein